MATLKDTCPPNFSSFNHPRLTGRAGGLAIVYRDNFNCSTVDFGTFSSFETFSILLKGKMPILCVLIYRPPKLPGFLKEFAEFLSIVMAQYDRICIVGDFNLHVCCPSSNLVTDFITLYESFNLIQHITGPTHIKGHTLDLILTHGISLNDIEDIDFPPSDHKALFFKTVLPTFPPQPPRSSRSRSFKPNSGQKFQQAFPVSTSPPPSSVQPSVNDLVNNFNSTCSQILDSIAPFKIKVAKPKTMLWQNNMTKEIKKQCRKAERKWKKDKLMSSHNNLRDLMFKYQSAVKNARSDYLSTLIATHSNNSREMFQTIQSVINPPPSQPIEASPEKCEEFLKHFLSKIEGIRLQLSPDPSVPIECPSPPSQLTSLTPITLPALLEIVTHMKTTSCSLDIIPTAFLKENIMTVAPTILSIMNRSLSSGIVPSNFKNAVVQPLLKKVSLDPLVLNNFRPISKLPFLSKVLEKIVSNQLITFMNFNTIFEKFQSGFRAMHSTETALLKVTNDLLVNADKGDCSILFLLDLSSAFDTVNHLILIQRLKEVVGINETALEWFRSYLTDRSFSVEIGEASSAPAPFTCGVPQGSILGPLLFTIYMLPIGNIIRSHGIHFHSYADDTQLYIPLKPGISGNVTHLLACLSDIKKWMSQNFLQLNEAKTEIILFGPPMSTLPFHAELGTLSSNITLTARSLGVMFDPQLSFNKQITTVVQSCYHQIRNIAKIKSFLSTTDLETVIHAFISSRLDYCNSLYSACNKNTISRLQMVQNSAARLLTNTKKRDHITPILAALHWLPVSYRIDFKILLITFKALHGLAPSYIKDLLVPYKPERNLRSANKALLEPPEVNLVTQGGRAFSARATVLWNTLPTGLRFADSVSSFKSRLKTHLYIKCFL